MCSLNEIAELHVMAHPTRTPLMPLERITCAILVLRGQRVILDRELAAIYGVTTKRLNEQVKRNAERFPEDFMFQLTAAEAELSRSQIATLNGGRGHNIKYLPHAFTEHGAIQASNVLNSPRAVAMGVYVVRAFVHLRELLSSNRELARRFAQLETRLDKKLTEQDRAIGAILSAIRELMHPKPPVANRRPIGFTADLEESDCSAER
jgi:hypothetical protein